jgi:hypothetical protein
MRKHLLLLLSARWTPDGKRLSFLSGSAMYLVPVDD